MNAGWGRNLAALVLGVAASLVAVTARADDGTGGGGSEGSGDPSGQAEVSSADSAFDAFYGSAQHAVSIAVPDFHAIEPKLSIAYDSSGGNGYVGVGWQLRGSSVIERATPGRGAPAYGPDDVFVLDGAELVPCASAAASPGCIAGGTHATKIESYQRIVFNAAALSWTITQSSGTKLTYAPTVWAGPYVFRWGLVSVVDTSSNTVSYGWSCDAGGIDCYVGTITYGGTTITLYRETRPDPVSFAMGGATGIMTDRLKAIDVTVGGSRLRTYELSYAASATTGRSLLTGVQTFGRDAVLDGRGAVVSGSSLPATTATYTAGTNALGFTVAASTAWGATLAASSPARTFTGDFNGDGKTDYLFANNDGSLWVGLSNGTTFQFWRWYANAAWGPVFAATSAARTMTGDFNGDGKTDFLFTYSDGTVWVGISTGTSFTFQIWYSNPPFGPVIAASSPVRTFTGDFNGDGKTDFLFTNVDGTWWVGLSTGTSLVFSVWASNPAWANLLAAGSAARTFVADFNGDGKSDFLFTYADGTWTVGLSTGTKLVFTQWYAAPSWGKILSAAPASLPSSCWETNPAYTAPCASQIAQACVGVSPSATCAGQACSTYCANPTADCEVASGASPACANQAPPARTFVADFNGDGKADFLLLAPDGNWWVGLSDGMRFVFTSWHYDAGAATNLTPWTWTAAGCATPTASCMTTCQNYYAGQCAIGCAGLSCTSVGGVSCYKPNTQAACFSACGGQLLCPPTPSSARTFAGDFNGDGRSDFMFTYSDGTAWVGRSTGSSFVVERWYDSPGWGPVVAAASAARTFVGDFDGDGKTDMLFNWTDGSFWVGKSVGPISDLVATVSNGLGGSTTFQYAPSSAWANTNNPPVTPTVSAITTADGRGAAATTTLTYAGGLVDPIERRFMGFHYARKSLPCVGAECVASNVVGPGPLVLGPYVDTWFHQDYGSVSKPEKTIHYSSSGMPLAQTVHGYTTNASVVPYTSLETTHDEYTYDGMGSACPGANCKGTCTGRSFDANGVVALEISYGDCDAAGDEKSLYYEYHPNTSSFLIGRPARVDTYAGVGSAGQLLESTLYYYDGASAYATPPVVGRLTQTAKWSSTGNAYVVSKSQYDGYGNVTTTTDALGAVTKATFDPTYHRFVTSVTNALGQTVTRQFDPVCGVTSSTTDANGQTTTTAHDVFCRATTSTGPLGSSRSNLYVAIGDPNHQYVEVDTPSADGKGAQWTRTYTDGLGRTYRVESKGPSASATIVNETTYDARGRVATASAPHYAADAPVWTSTSYDAIGRPLVVTHADGTSITKSYALRTATTTNETGFVTTDTTDAYGHRVAHREGSGAGAFVLQYQYDVRGNLVTTIDAAGNTTTYAFDSLGRKTSMRDPDMGTWTYQYDAGGHLVSQTDARGQVETFAYDVLGRKVRDTMLAGTPQATTSTWTYDEARPGYVNVGSLTTESDPYGTATTDYDALGRAVRVARSIDGVVYATLAGFDAGGRPLWTSLPDGDSVGTAASPLLYDGAGRLTTIPGIVTSALYDAAGRVTSQTNANGTVTKRTFSAQRGLLTGIATSAGATTIQNLTYTRRADGKVTQIASPFAGESWTYAYDAFGRLASAVDPTNAANAQTFAYDALGNVTSNSLVGAYVYPAAGQARPHAVSQAGANKYVYDANGNMTSGAGRTLTYDASNRPLTVTSGGATSQFVYDGDGHRIAKTFGGSKTIYLGDDFEETGGVVTKYVMLAGTVVAKRVGYGPSSVTSWIHSDRQGSIQAITDGAGKVVQRMAYRPYGDRLSTATSFTEARGYISERQDETGLFYLHARYYDPALARFVSPDPTTPGPDQVDLNRYAYSDNDPITNLDPSGYDDEGSLFDMAANVVTFGGWGALESLNTIASCFDGDCSDGDFKQALGGLVVGGFASGLGTLGLAAGGFEDGLFDAFASSGAGFAGDSLASSSGFSAVEDAPFVASAFGQEASPMAADALFQSPDWSGEGLGSSLNGASFMDSASIMDMTGGRAGNVTIDQAAPPTFGGADFNRGCADFTFGAITGSPSPVPLVFDPIDPSGRAMFGADVQISRMMDAFADAGFSMSPEPSFGSSGNVDVLNERLGRLGLPDGTPLAMKFSDHVAGSAQWSAGEIQGGGVRMNGLGSLDELARNRFIDGWPITPR